MRSEKRSKSLNVLNILVKEIGTVSCPHFHLPLFILSIKKGAFSSSREVVQYLQNVCIPQVLSCTLRRSWIQENSKSFFKAGHDCGLKGIISLVPASIWVVRTSTSLPFPTLVSSTLSFSVGISVGTLLSSLIKSDHASLILYVSCYSTSAPCTNLN